MVVLFRKACILLACLLLYSTNFLHAGDADSLNPSLELVVEIPTTSVKNQGRSGTCWSFATISLIETELLRTKQAEYNFSEMYVVRHAYLEKARKYIRLHGNLNFSGGGEANDVLNVYDKHGFLPESVYSGKVIDRKKHNHKALDHELSHYIDSVLIIYNEDVAKNWELGFEAILDNHLGTLPKKGKKQTKDTLSGLGNEELFSSDDYILLTSFTHHPYYHSFILELPDNWSWGAYYNLPLNEFKQVVDSALYNNYSVVWAADYSEDGFLFKNGIAVAPSVVYKESLSKAERRFLQQEEEPKVKVYSDFNNPVEEVDVNADIRQVAFDNHSTTDDHLMHIVGVASGPTGNQYYYVKNSWGAANVFNGYFYVSEPYFLYKSISVMVHKDAIPKSISEKIVWK